LSRAQAGVTEKVLPHRGLRGHQVTFVILVLLFATSDWISDSRKPPLRTRTRRRPHAAQG
jgi:hypothetical protein